MCKFYSWILDPWKKFWIFEEWRISSNRDLLSCCMLISKKELNYSTKMMKICENLNQVNSNHPLLLVKNYCFSKFRQRWRCRKTYCNKYKLWLFFRANQYTKFVTDGLIFNQYYFVYSYCKWFSIRLY